MVTDIKTFRAKKTSLLKLSSTNAGENEMMCQRLAKCHLFAWNLSITVKTLLFDLLLLHHRHHHRRRHHSPPNKAFTVRY